MTSKEKRTEKEWKEKKRYEKKRKEKKRKESNLAKCTHFYWQVLLCYCKQNPTKNIL